MKILHLIYTNSIAGAEKYLVNLLPGLKKYNIACDLICVCPKSSATILLPYCQAMNDMGITTTLLQGNKKNFLSISKMINSYLKKEGISVIHAHLSNADLLAVLTKIIYNKKLFIISSKHGYDEQYLVKYDANAKQHVIDKNLYYYYTKFLLKYINVNLATSKAIADLYYNIKLTSKSFHFIHHGINPIPLYADLKDPGATFQLMIVGRLEKVKGHQFLFEAMPKVLQHFPQTHLLILGNGNEKDNLMQQAIHLGINKHITFLGFRHDSYTFMSQSDIIIQPSSFESFGLVYIEAFALKVPVIAFNVPAANEIITDNETGLLVSSANAEILAEKIIYLLQYPAERKRLSENAYAKYLQSYTAEIMIAKTSEWYKTLSLPGKVNAH